MIIEKKKLSELKPAPYNPRQSTAKQEKHLKASLEKFGVVEPIIYNKQTGYIVGGHFRVRELTKLGYKEVECVIVDLNEEDERELNIRLNANTGEWDWDSLANEWDAEKLDDWGLDLPIIMNEPSLDELIGEEKNKPASMKITFKTVEQLQEAENDIQELIDRKYNGAFYSVSAGEL
jgi:ParB-like chromosome segregation protein Spo0J